MAPPRPRAWWLVLVGAASGRAATLGIVGSGVAGAGTARFARELMPDVEIVVWERDAVVGGRAKSVNVTAAGASREVDAGATAISTLNEYLVNFTSGMTRRSDSRGRKTLGIYDGSSFRLKSGEGSLEMAAHLLERYGVGWLKLMPALQETVANLSRIYNLQTRGVAFDTPMAMLQELGLYQTTQITAYEYPRPGVNQSGQRRRCG